MVEPMKISNQINAINDPMLLTSGRGGWLCIFCKAEQKIVHPQNASGTRAAEYTVIPAKHLDDCRGPLRTLRTDP